MTHGFHRGSIPAVLGGLAVLCALAGCAPAADYGVAPESPRQKTLIPAPFQIPGPRAPERVVVIGDSLSTGYGTSAEEAWPRQLDPDLRPGQLPVEIINAARDGAGYVAADEQGETFGSQVAATLDASTDIVVFFGSDNDGGQDPADVKAAVEDALAESKTVAPHAALIVIGPLTAFDPAVTDLDVIRDQERSAALDAGAEFVDPIAENWIPGPDSPLLGPDGEHPSSQGQQFLKERIQGILTSLQSPSAVPSDPKTPTNASTPPASGQRSPGA
ncbi:SGNH/GDSL hydrolase family protein [Arthrobacter sp. PsM3]|uniref:SGNH/GDSL hydrolase family protein n=1 Tax=Arthrobacter sp. PsM3 TaxID=3030531 RepID=UPI00263BB35E|nr:SGNH/GDSL hydrolase family protein [Arthrobacter sp. PsM3]MDN4646190.1 SGNH/GDSL hydrolase family protein [Arthrobacter sp. PsM3]